MWSWLKQRIKHDSICGDDGSYLQKTSFHHHCELMKKALVTPLFKKGNHSDPVNYHPISLTSVCCKLLEYNIIIYSNITSHLSEHYVLSDAQFELWHRNLTELWLLCTIHDFASNLNNKNRLILITHCLLKLKLNFYDIKYQAYWWISSFSSKQMHCVVYSCHISAPFDVISGIPQDTVLDPLFFW